MSSLTEDGCQGISSNPDISGPGVRIALYLQSLLSVLLIRFSPRDAPGAYWAMTSTAFSLIISSFVTSAQKQISLLDAIVVVYVTLLPVLASAFGLSEIMNPPSRNATRAVQSPLLIVANWVRSALTYSFAMYVWIAAPTLGSDADRACNEQTRLIFFGASLPALGSGRYLSLAGWGLFSLLFVYRALKGRTTIVYATHALFSSIAGQKLLRPRRDPKNEVHRESVVRKDFATGKVTQKSRLFRPKQIFHDLIQGVASQILGWAPTGTDKWYKKYGKAILVGFLASWVVIMTELELVKNNVAKSEDQQWGFGQILPLLLTISPLFSLWESFLSRRAAGPSDEPRRIRFTIHGARGLQRPHCELDPYPPEEIEKLDQARVEQLRAPTPFAVITINDEEMYTTFHVRDAHAPEWEETFDAEVSDLAAVVVRVFDRKCVDNGWPAFIGFVVVHPFSAMPLPSVHAAEADDDASSVAHDAVLTDLPLIYEGKTRPDMTISVTLSTDTREEPTLRVVPPFQNGPLETRVERRVNLVKWGNKKRGRKKETTTDIYQVANF